MPPTLPLGLRKRGVVIASSVAAVGLAAGVAVALPGNGASSVVADPNARAAVASAGAQAQQEAEAAKAVADKAAAQKAAAAKAAADKVAAQKAAAVKAAAEKLAAEKLAAARAAAEKAAAANRSEQRAPLTRPTPQAAPQTQQAAPAAPSGTPQEIAAQIVPADQLASFDQIISHESGWNVTATNPSSGAYGLAQALPGSKMASAGPDWQTDPATQIRWALGYMNATYGSPNQAWAFWQANGWY